MGSCLYGTFFTVLLSARSFLFKNDRCIVIYTLLYTVLNLLPELHIFNNLFFIIVDLNKSIK